MEPSTHDPTKPPATIGEYCAYVIEINRAAEPGWMILFLYPEAAQGELLHELLRRLLALNASTGEHAYLRLHHVVPEIS